VELQYLLRKITHGAVQEENDKLTFIGHISTLKSSTRTNRQTEIHEKLKDRQKEITRLYQIVGIQRERQKMNIR